MWRKLNWDFVVMVVIGIGFWWVTLSWLLERFQQ